MAGANAIRVGMIGLGGWGRNVVRALHRAQGAELAWICDREPGLLAAEKSNYPRARGTLDHRELLADPGIEAVAIATPADTHHALAREALLAGKHVFVEKPLALSSADAADLVESARVLRRKLMVGHLLKFHPAVERMKQELDAGTLGELRYLYTQRLNLGVVRSQENAFWSLAPHDISVILYLLGTQPDRISAQGECYLQGGVEDVVFANLHFADGRMAQIHVSWLDPSKERRMVLVGSRRMLVFDDMQPAEKIRIFDSGAQVPDAVSAGDAIAVRHGDIHIPRLPSGEPLDRELQHFIDCIREDRTPRTDGRDGLAVVRVLEAVEQQLARGRAACRACTTPPVSAGGQSNGSPLSATAS